jgi:hypothetical protein
VPLPLLYSRARDSKTEHAKNSGAPYRSSVAGVRVYRRRLGNVSTKVRLPPTAEERRSAQANPQPQ